VGTAQGLIAIARGGKDERKSEMANDNDANSQHLRQQQDHYRWRQEHRAALALLKRAEAKILDHEAVILAHEAEIARHEEQIAHGDAHAEAPPAGEHGEYTARHEGGAENHQGLLDAIRRIEAYL